MAKEAAWREPRRRCHPARRAASAGSEGTAGESRGREAREVPEKVASVVARVAASREVTVVAPASGAKQPGEGGRESVSGELVSRVGGLGTRAYLLQATLEARGQDS